MQILVYTVMDKMKIQSYILLKVLILLVGLSIVFTSCISQKKIRYLQGNNQADTIQVNKNAMASTYRLCMGDNLYIRVTGLDEKMNNIFNLTSGGSNASMGNSESGGAYLSSYTVSNEGTIDFPVVGSVNVVGLTLSEAKTKLFNRVSEYIKQPTIIIKLTSFNITLLGEWKSPGKKPILQEKLTIFEAVGIGGDLLPFANRKKIRLVRQVDDKVNIVLLDLTSKDIIKSEYYYLRPNDILYAEAYTEKVWSFEAFPYSLLFSSITMAMVLWNYFK